MPVPFRRRSAALISMLSYELHGRTHISIAGARVRCSPRSKRKPLTGGLTRIGHVHAGFPQYLEDCLACRDHELLVAARKAYCESSLHIGLLLCHRIFDVYCSGYLQHVRDWGDIRNSRPPGCDFECCRASRQDRHDLLRRRQDQPAGTGPLIRPGRCLQSRDAVNLLG